MRSLDRLTMVSLLLIGIGICATNVWFAAARSTIPIGLKGTVTLKRIGLEKHPGVDDAYMLALDGGNVICVDKLVYDEVRMNDDIEKQPWQREIMVAGKVVSLTLSRDFYGLAWCMTLAAVIMTLLVVCELTITKYP